MRMYLLLLGASEADATRHDVEGEVVIGREPGGLVLDDAEVSRRHARVFAQPDGVLIVEDLASRNGTHVNGERIRAEYVLAIGDRITIGETVFQVAGDAVPETRLSSPPRVDETVIRGAQTPPPAPEQRERAAPQPAADPPPVAAPALAAGDHAAARASVIPNAPFGRHAPGARHGTIASRRVAPTALTFLVIVATAVALIVYFAMH